MMMGFGFFGLFLMLILWVGLILGAVLLVRYLFQGSRQPPSLPQNNKLKPQQILEQRYARGEITREQFDSMKQDLTS